MNDISVPLQYDLETAALKVPPHSIEAEQAVLGGLMLDNNAWERVLEAAEAGPLVVVTHGLVGLSLATRHLTLPESETPALTGLANASLTSVESTPPHRVTRFNCTAHLEDAAAPGAPA